MAFNFTPDLPVLNLGPRRHTRWSSREFVLWPAWAYRVVAPRVQRRNLNVLQRAVLGMCRANVCGAEDIASQLFVHADLVALVLTELTNRDYLNKFGLLTTPGLQALESDSLEAHEMVAGHVFQDPWTADLWPRFVETLDYCELDYNDKGFPSLVLGTTGKPSHSGAFMVMPRKEVVPVTPSASAVVEAVARHRKGLRFRDADDEDDEPIGEFAASVAHVDRVSFVEAEPQPVFLMTYLYVPESADGALDWYACDPFGLGQSVRLRRRVEAVMHEIPGLFGVVNRLVGQTLHDGYEEQQRWHEAIEIQAGLEIDRRLSVNVRNHPSFDYLLAMESSRQEVRSLGRDCPERKLQELMRSGLKVLESVFSSMANEHPLGEIWKRVYVRREDRRSGKRRFVQQQDTALLVATYESAVRAVGFAEPIPQSFVNVKPGQIRSVADYGDHWRLRPLVTATLLLADVDPIHPLRDVARRDPQLLIAVDAIATSGGAAGHAQGGTVGLSDAEKHVEKVYAAVSCLLGLESVEAEHSDESIGADHG